MRNLFTPKSTNRAPHRRITRGKPIPTEKITFVNELFYDKGWSIHRVVREGRVSMSVAERALFYTKEEWTKFKSEKQVGA